MGTSLLSIHLTKTLVFKCPALSHGSHYAQISAKVGLPCLQIQKRGHFERGRKVEGVVAYFTSELFVCEGVPLI